MDKSKVKIVYRKISELKEPDYNPRKITAKQREDIKKSLQQFGFVQPLVVNIHEDRFGIIVGGNQRKKIAESMGYDEAPCIEVSLDLEKEKELNLRLNKNQAEFDYEMLNNFFDKKFLFEVGFTDKELGKIQSEFEEKFKAITNDNAEMPIVQQFNEKYNTVMIFCNNEMDFNWLRNVLRLQRMKDYKNSKIGESHVITVQQFQEIWEEATDVD
jgi:hypothetical protein